MAVGIMAGALALVWVFSMLVLKKDLGKAKNKPKFKEIFSKSRAINYLSAARLFLFGARDVWFVVALPVFIATGLLNNISQEFVLLLGLMIFGVLFAINSSLHSYLIVSYASEDGVSLDVGFYYMANAVGRLMGTVLSGWLYQVSGLIVCLWVSMIFIIIAALLSLALPKHRILVG